MTEFLKKIEALSLLPVIRIEQVEDATPLAHALTEGGLPVAEITFRTPCAAEAIREMKRAVPEMLVGAGTVLTVAQADEAIAAGAAFIVSPGLDATVVRHCLTRGVPILPGCATPTDVQTAFSLGLHTVKFFPAEAAGGLPMLRAMAAPYGDVRFMPTGGITPQNLTAYLACPAVIACGGSFMVSEGDLRDRNFAAIREKTAAALRAMLDLRIERILLPCKGQDTSALPMLYTLFGSGEARADACFSGDVIVLSAEPLADGATCRVELSTPCLARAIAYFERTGHRVAPDSRKADEKGRLTEIDLASPVLGISIRLLARK